MVRFAFATSILACALLAPGTADAAGAVLPREAKASPSFVDVRMAVAVSPAGTTRWSEISVPAETPVMWLAPVRPGAAIDWAPRRWLDALDDATALRVLPPSSAPACASWSTPETPARWTQPRPSEPATSLAVHSTADSVRAYVAERGYRLTFGLATRISDLYASGWKLAAIEMAPSSSAVSSGTLRVSDDGGALLPLALTAGSSTRVTVFAIGKGAAAIPGARDVDPFSLQWGTAGSTFTEWRRELVDEGRGETWLRESSSHDAIFDGTSVADGDAIASVVAGYFDGTACATSPAQNLGSRSAPVGTTCAPGAAARVPGGSTCVPSVGGDPAALSCNADIDLALALSGLAPASAVVTRLVGWVPAGASGRDLLIDFDSGAKRSPVVVRATESDPCPAVSPAPASPGASSSTSSGSFGAGDVYVPASDGCGGSTATTTTTYEEETVVEDDGSSTESCSGDGSSSSSSSSSDWDESDSSDSCSTDDSSSSSSDSCSSKSSSSSSGGSDDGWDSEDDDDGWDSDDDMSPKGKTVRPASKKPRPHAKATKKKSSPVSRYALLAAALLLPLRRKRRDAERA